MDWSKYSSLKSGSKVSFGKEKQVMREAVAEVKYKKGDDDIPDYAKVGDVKVHAEAKEERSFVVLAQKRWDGQTGEALSDSKSEYTLSQLESEKGRFDSEIARAKAQSDGLAAAIVDFKKL